jgi:hypothetical protein
MKRFRNVSIYYRNSDGIMKKIPNVKLFLDKGFGGRGVKGEKLVKVYTLPPGKVPQEIILED